MSDREITVEDRHDEIVIGERSVVTINRDSLSVESVERPGVVESDGEHVVVVSEVARQEVEVTKPEQIVIDRRVVDVIEKAKQGPPGPQGPIGPAGGAAFERQSDGALSALRVVWEDGSGVVRPLDYRDEDHINLIAGLTLTGTPAAGAATVQRGGPVDDAAWAWTPGRVWLGADGALTQTPPADGFDVLVGYAVSPTRLYLDIQDNIELED